MSKPSGTSRRAERVTRRGGVMDFRKPGENFLTFQQLMDRTAKYLRAVWEKR